MCRLAVLLDFDQCARAGRRRPMHEHARWIDVGCPHILELVPCVSLPNDNRDRSIRCWKSQRFVKGPVDLGCFIRRFPLTVDRRKPARVQDAPLRVAHLEEILPQVGAVDRLVGIAGPLERLDDDPIEAEYLLLGVAGMVVIHAQRLGCGRCADRGKRKRDGENGGKQRTHAHVVLYRRSAGMGNLPVRSQHATATACRRHAERR